MAKKEPKPKEPKPWDRRPWPASGDISQEHLYAGIGRALSEWERHEAALSFVFASLTEAPHSMIPRRAYNAVRTFEGRAYMLRAASEAYFSVHPDPALLDQYKAVLQGATALAPRRNDIAHGAVDHYRPEPPAPEQIPAPDSYALFPSYASFKERGINNDPAYCYTSVELEYFRQHFFILKSAARLLALALIRAQQKRASRGKLRGLYRRATNPAPDQTDPQE